MGIIKVPSVQKSGVTTYFLGEDLTILTLFLPPEVDLSSLSSSLFLPELCVSPPPPGTKESALRLKFLGYHHLSALYKYGQRSAFSSDIFSAKTRNLEIKIAAGLVKLPVWPIKESRLRNGADTEPHEELTTSYLDSTVVQVRSRQSGSGLWCAA